LRGNELGFKTRMMTAAVYEGKKVVSRVRAEGREKDELTGEDDKKMKSSEATSERQNGSNLVVSPAKFELKVAGENREK